MGLQKTLGKTVVVATLAHLHGCTHIWLCLAVGSVGVYANAAFARSLISDSLRSSLCVATDQL